MLIIAIPKSASTSLTSTLGQLHDRETAQLIFPGLEMPDDYQILPGYHSDIRNYPEELLRIYCESRVFFKQHIPPTEFNRKNLRFKKKVVILRPPNEIIEAYRRAEIKKIHPKRPEFKGAADEATWQQIADEIGMTEDLNKFFHGWLEAADEFTLILYSHDLIQNPTAAIQAVERFFALAVTEGNVILARERYSRDDVNLSFRNWIANKVLHTRDIILHWRQNH